MEKHSSILRGLVNDLLRSLSAALVHVDDLIMKVERNSDLFPDAILTNEQLSRSIELFLDLRSEFSYFIEQLIIKHKYLMGECGTLSHWQEHTLNDILTAFFGSCDLMLLDNNKKLIKNNIALVIESIENQLELHEPINKNEHHICNNYKPVLQEINSLKYNSHKFLKGNFKNNFKRILLVEDNKAVRDITSITLRQARYKVFESENTESAINTFYQEKGDFDLFIIDLGLPDGDGIKLANELIAQKQINILFTSGQDESFLNRHKIMIGKFNFLRKPYRISTLTDMVGKLCQ